MKIDAFFKSPATRTVRRRVPPSPGERVMAGLTPNRTFGYPGGWSYQDRTQQVMHFKTWAYAAVHINASLVGQHTPNLAWVGHTDDPQYDPRRDVRKWYGMGQGLTTGGGRHHPGPYAPGREHTVGTRLAAAARTGHGLMPGYARYKAYSTVKPHEELEPLPPDHALRRLVVNPNPYDTTYTLLYELIMFLKLCGTAYLWCVPDGWGMPCELWVIPSHWVWPYSNTYGPNPHDQRLVDYYQIRPYMAVGPHAMLNIPREEMICFKYPSPLSQVDGWSKLTAGDMWQDVSESIDKSAWAQVQNQGMPSCFIEYPETGSNLDDDLIARLEAKFAQKFGGEYNVGKPLFGSAGMKVTPLSFSPESMMYPQMGEAYRDKMLALFGIPKSALGITEGMTYGSILACLAQVCAFVINPDFALLQQQLSKDLCPRFLSVGTPGDGASLLDGADLGYLRDGAGKKRILTDAEAYRLGPLYQRAKRNQHTGQLDLELRWWWDDCTPPDPAQVNADIAQDVSCLAISPDEIRAIRGRAAWGHPAAALPWVNGPNGWMPIPLGDVEQEALADLARRMEPLSKMGAEQGGDPAEGGEAQGGPGMDVPGEGDGGMGQPPDPADHPTEGQGGAGGRNGDWATQPVEGAAPALDTRHPSAGTDHTVRHPNGRPQKSLAKANRRDQDLVVGYEVAGLHDFRCRMCAEGRGIELGDKPVRGRDVYLGDRCPGCGQFYQGDSSWDSRRLKALPVQAGTPAPVAAGLAVVAEDTGRVLLLQRQHDPKDPNAGTWELPGGKIDPGLSPLETACKEWTEEVGLPLPQGRLGRGRWLSGDGKYAGFVYRTPQEAAVQLNCRSEDADPESGGWAAVAWVEPDALSNHHLRPALKRDVDDVLEQIRKYLLGGVVRKGLVNKGRATSFVNRLPDSVWAGDITVTVPINLIDLNQGEVEATRRDIKAGRVSRTPNRPIDLYYTQDGRLIVQDGMHRLVPEMDAGRTFITAFIEEMGKVVGSVVTKGSCKPGETAASTGCTPLGGGGGKPAGGGGEVPRLSPRLRRWMADQPVRGGKYQLDESALATLSPKDRAAAEAWARARNAEGGEEGITLAEPVRGGPALSGNVLRHARAAVDRDRHLPVDVRTLFRQLKQDHPGLTVPEFHRQLLAMRDAGQVTLEEVTRDDTSQGLLSSEFPLRAEPDRHGGHRVNYGYVRPKAAGGQTRKGKATRQGGKR